MDEDFQREIKTDPKSVSSHHPNLSLRFWVRYGQTRPLG